MHLWSVVCMPHALLEVKLVKTCQIFMPVCMADMTGNISEVAKHMMLLPYLVWDRVGGHMLHSLTFQFLSVPSLSFSLAPSEFAKTLRLVPVEVNYLRFS